MLYELPDWRCTSSCKIDVNQLQMAQPQLLRRVQKPSNHWNLEWWVDQYYCWFSHSKNILKFACSSWTCMSILQVLMFPYKVMFCNLCSHVKRLLFNDNKKSCHNVDEQEHKGARETFGSDGTEMAIREATGTAMEKHFTRASQGTYAYCACVSYHPSVTNKYCVSLNLNTGRMFMCRIKPTNATVR